MSRAFVDAQQWIGTEGEAFELSGRAQFDILMSEGLHWSDHVLEIGCGALAAGQWLIRYLGADRYVGIEPQAWLIREASVALELDRAFIPNRRPRFVHRTDFDGSCAAPEGGFRWILSHSILSHVSRGQLIEFLKNARKVVAKDGVACVSLHLGAETTAGEEWSYPESIYFTRAEAEDAAKYAGWAVEWRPDWRARMMREFKPNDHEWMKLTPAERSGR